MNFETNSSGELVVTFGTPEERQSIGTAFEFMADSGVVDPEYRESFLILGQDIRNASGLHGMSGVYLECAWWGLRALHQQYPDPGVRHTAGLLLDEMLREGGIDFDKNES